MKKAISILFIGLLTLAFGTICFADEDSTSTVFKGSGHNRGYYNNHHSFKRLVALEALNDLDGLNNLDLELDELDNELSELRRDCKNKYRYNYNYDYDYDYEYSYDYDYEYSYDYDYYFDDDNHHVYNFGDGQNFSHCNNMDIDFENDEIYITHSGRKSGTIRITENYELYINGKHIETDKEQQKLLEEFYNSAEELHKYAATLGAKGAEIGIEGAKIGLSAIGGIFKLILPGYDSDDLEREMERKSKRIEYKASSLEKEAEVLEYIAYEIEDIADKLKDEIPELRKLRWF